MEDKEVKIESVSVKDVQNTGEHVKKSESKQETESSEQMKIKELTAELADVKDKYLRTAAELENTRRRAALDAESRARVRAISVIEKILPVADAVDAALKHAPDDEGIKSLAMALESAFVTIGIHKMETVGKALDPLLHNAIQVIEAPDGVAQNTVIEELQAGYMLDDTVLRTAMVIVAK
ncbi:MAG: nucleotide exchange factor GrpE [Alphaproteobacteria bacterium]|nr:nucleotide exchange factor GrpE [Alphaproteobacteria bacterium]